MLTDQFFLISTKNHFYMKKMYAILMGCCQSTPISQTLADEIREIEHASYPNYYTAKSNYGPPGCSPFQPINENR